ncbi:MAG: LysM peptidoglycan-binding domain-containing protein [Candidatus Bruticola sp.]
MEETLGEDLLLSKEGIGLVNAAAAPGDYFQVGTEKVGNSRIYLRYQLFTTLNKLALNNTAQAQAGLLLGSHVKDNSWIKIDEAVEVKPQSDNFTEVVWKRAFAQASKKHPGMSVVGWFHSHPGTGSSLTDLEKEIHQKFFPKQSQVIYIVDPVIGERSFYLWRDGELQNSGGFRIYGKTAVNSTIVSREPTRQEDYLDERYLERSIDKFQRMLRNPVVRPIDYIILVLIGLCLMVQLLRPAPVAKVDQHEVLANQIQISQQIDSVEKRVKVIEGQLEAVGVLDKELGLLSTPAAEPIAVSEEKANTVKTTESKLAQKEESSVKAAPSGSKVIIHNVQSGETISSIAEKYYSTTDPKVCKALGKFNKLPAPYYDHIVPGDKLKIPARQKVGL